MLNKPTRYFTVLTCGETEQLNVKQLFNTLKFIFLNTSIKSHKKYAR